MPPDLDIGQIIIIVIAVVAGFIQWAWKVIQQNKEERNRARESMTDEERLLREAAWQRQTGQRPPASTSPSPPPPRPSPTSTQPPQDPWSSLREVFETVKEEMRKAQELEAPVPTRPPAPPPIPARSTTPAPPPLPTTAAPTLPHPPRPSPVRAPLPPPVQPLLSLPPTPSPVPLPVLVRSATTQAARDEFAGLRALLMSRDTVRQGILLREILGPPKALQSSSDSPF